MLAILGLRDRGGQVIRPMLVSTLERGLWRSVAAGDDYESQVIYLDAYSPHMDTSAAALMESRGDVLVFLGGGTTSIHQVNDTRLHQNLKKEYKKYMSSKNTGSAAEE